VGQRQVVSIEAAYDLCAGLRVNPNTKVKLEGGPQTVEKSRKLKSSDSP
jgi:hypothetical protein